MRTGFIGSGAMVAAIAKGGVAARMNTSDFLFANAHRVHAPALAAGLGVSITSSNSSLIHQVDILVLGMKPRAQSAVIKMITHIIREHPEMYVVSPAAGRTMEPIAKDFGAAVPIIRVMPNVNTQTGRSMSAVCSLGTSEGQVAAVEVLMNKVGRLIHIEEKDFPTFQTLAGYSPVWVFQIIEALAGAGVKHGLTREVSVTIVAQALAGSADLILEASGQDTVPSELIDRVCSPGGTTIVGLPATETWGMSACLISAIEATIARNAKISTYTR